MLYVIPEVHDEQGDIALTGTKSHSCAVGHGWGVPKLWLTTEATITFLVEERAVKILFPPLQGSPGERFGWLSSLTLA